MVVNVSRVAAITAASSTLQIVLMFRKGMCAFAESLTHTRCHRFAEDYNAWLPAAPRRNIHRNSRRPIWHRSTGKRHMHSRRIEMRLHSPE